VTDELSTPLGQEPRKARRAFIPGFMSIGAVGLLGAVLAGFALWTVIVDDPLGGEPIAVVSLAPSPAQPPAGAAQTPSSAAPANSPETPATPVPMTAQSGGQTVTIIDGMSGKREQVTISAPPDANKPAVGPAAVNGPQKLTLDARIADGSRHGPIPKIGADGARASDLYAAENKGAAATNLPRVALVIGRLGVSANLTTDALAKLPPAVTLAFPPYGTDLDRWTARARGEGHEILLQVPMEPFDFPENDPGPQTLLTSLPAD
jgi:uncharacterized protein